MKALLVIDDSNIAMQAKRLGRLADYVALRGLVDSTEAGRTVWETVLVSTLPPQNGEGIGRYHHVLRNAGVIVVAKPMKALPDGSWKGNVDVLLAVETLRYVEGGRPGLVVLASGDGDFAPLAMYLRGKGIRVEVASLRESLAGELREAANAILDLKPWAEQCKPLVVSAHGADDARDAGW